MAEADRDRLLDTALGLAAREGWRAVTLNGIAREAGVPLSRVHDAFPSKWAILDAIADRVDEAVLARLSPAAGEPVRDRLFDVLMRRFDAMRPFKEGVVAIAHDLGREPLMAFCAWPRLVKSMAWMLEAAGLDSSGLAGLVRAKVLGTLYLAALRTWLSDDSADAARTMAALDRGLRRAEAVARFLERRRPARPAKGGPARRTTRRRPAPRKARARRRRATR